MMLRLLTGSLLAVGVQGVTSSILNVISPQSLAKEGGYDHREALFGNPPYGGSISQNLYYADADMCDPSVLTGGYPERPVGSNGVMEPFPSPFVLMVDRGGCTFVQKARNAQRIGASALIVADNVCLCSDQDCVSSDASAPCATNEPILADDGSGSDISIPSMLMFKIDADAIKEVARRNQNVQVEMSWPPPQQTDSVDYQIWTTPKDVVAAPFLKSFKDVAVALNGTAHFTPQMYIYDGVATGCTQGGNSCYNLCTNRGRYCATDPDNDLDRGISGADVVLESLRRVCIWKSYGEADGVGVEWWDYVSEFMFRCDNEAFFSHEACLNDVYEAANIDGSLISACMRDSGGLEADQTNTLLDQTLQMQQKSGVVVIPSVIVNSVSLRGRLDVSNVLEAICAAFTTNSKPPVCERCLSAQHSNDVEFCAKDVVDQHDSGEFGSSNEGETSMPKTNPAGKTGKVGKTKNVMKGMMNKKHGKKAKNKGPSKKTGKKNGVRGAGLGKDQGADSSATVSVSSQTTPKTAALASESASTTSENGGGGNTPTAGMLLLVGGIEALLGMADMYDDEHF